MRRTSVKVFLISLAFLVIGIACMSAAEAYYRSIPNRIDFGLDIGRPWNPWDYIWIFSFVVSAALAVVGFMFVEKDD